MVNFISEDDIEQAALQRLRDDYGYQLLNCYTVDTDTLNDRSHRTNKQDVILRDRLKAAALRLNPHIPETAIDEAIATVTQPRLALSTIAANIEIDGLLRNGIPVSYTNDQGRTEDDRVRLIDFNDPSPTGNNEFLAVSQLWIKKQDGVTSQANYRRPDILLYINGIPLVFIELKNSNINVKDAFDKNLTDYKRDIPQLFHPNALCILSNALETRVGSFTATWDYFFPWLRVDDEKEKVNRDQLRESGTSLERAIAGLCAPAKLLDYIENFVLYYNDTQKIIAQNHQFIGVNRAIESTQDQMDPTLALPLVRGGDRNFPPLQGGTEGGNSGKLGVFWHTQGSGKSFSMIFYVRKIFRKIPGNYTFVVITDRDDLDGQIYNNFLNTGTVAKKEPVRPKNSEQMREYLSKNQRMVFTLIQKFRWPKGKAYPVLSDRSDIIVIVDEAHRTQYKSLAENMRRGLPNASYLAFTGTPLLGKDRKTNTWFGDYVSEYNFSQSMDDGATVPLFYQKRVPEVLIQNEDLSDEFYQILEDENLDDGQQAKLEKRFATELEIIKRDDRLERIAEDIVYHFPRRGYLGKGLVVSVDKFTTVKMYEKVQRLWKAEIKTLIGRINKSQNDIEKARLKKILAFMRDTHMAVVISFENSEDETKRFADKGLDIKPHRDRFNTVDAQGHDVKYQFKQDDHPLRLVFVCAMWLTGFDVPSLSTVYLDKPMRDHTLMQAITRANRVCGYTINTLSKDNGEIIDYYNVFRNMQQALANYALGGDGPDDNSADDGSARAGDTDGTLPVASKDNLFVLLDEAIAQGLAFCRSHDIDLEPLAQQNDAFQNLGQFEEYTNILLSRDEWRKEFAVYENTITSLCEACKPEILIQPRPLVAVFQYLRGIIDSHLGNADIDAVTTKITDLLDESVVSESEDFRAKEYGAEYKILQQGQTWDLSQTNFEQLKTDFKQVKHKHIKIADLRSFLAQKINQMLQRNVTRTDFAQRFQAIIDQYNAGGSSTENYYEALVDFAENLQDEEERHIREGLTEPELELFDLLKKEKMTVDETQQVKLAAKSLLNRLLDQQPKVLVQDWHSDNQSQEKVKTAVEEVLDETLPDTYNRMLFKAKCDKIFKLIYTSAQTGQKWAG